ncbi:MAG: SDR family oxidoreductase [Chloroflexi bacterium]|nr:SDR family oxidoreductase [Chloroflexota bacterium]
MATKHLDINDKTALITGGSSGIGLAIAKQFVKCGGSVILIARGENKLNQAAEILKPLCSLRTQTIEVVPLDVTDLEALTEKLTPYLDLERLPNFIFNSAGMSRPGYVEEIPLDVFKTTMDLNYHGTVNIVKHFLPALLDRGSGAIVNISSMAGVIGVFGYTAYSGSKFAVRGFSDALRCELKPKGIQVTIVYPPDTDTPQLAWEAQYKPYETHVIAGSDKAISADEVAAEILSGVLVRKSQVIPGSEAKFLHWAATHMGGLIYPIMDFLVSNARKKKASRK